MCPQGPSSSRSQTTSIRRDDTTAYNDWDALVTLPQAKAKILLKAVQERLSNMPYFASSSAIGSAVARRR